MISALHIHRLVDPWYQIYNLRRFLFIRPISQRLHFFLVPLISHVDLFNYNLWCLVMLVPLILGSDLLLLEPRKLIQLFQSRLYFFDVMLEIFILGFHFLLLIFGVFHSLENFLELFIQLLRV